jgi:predicted ATPase
MASRRNRTIDMPAPYLRRIWLDPSRIDDRAAYPFCLPFLRDEFDLNFDRSITIIAGENGTGKSTLLEGIAVLAGYDEAGGGKGYMPVDHSNAIEAMGGELSKALRASWLPKITNGWFSGRKASSLSRAISMRWRWSREAAGRHQTSSPTRTAKAFCGSSKSAASGRASSSSTNPNRHCRPRARSNF